MTKTLMKSLLKLKNIHHDMIMVTRNTKEFERIDDIVIQNWIDDEFF